MTLRASCRNYVYSWVRSNTSTIKQIPPFRLHIFVRLPFSCCRYCDSPALAIEPFVWPSLGIPEFLQIQHSLLDHHALTRPLFCLFCFIHPLSSPASNYIKLRLEIVLMPSHSFLPSRSSLETCRSHSLAARNSTSRGKNPAILLSFLFFPILSIMVVVPTLSFKCSSSGFLTLTVLTGTPRFSHAPHLIPFFPFLMILDPRTTSASDGVIWMKFECIHSLIPSIDFFLFQRPKDDEEEGKADQKAVRPPVT